MSPPEVSLVALVLTVHPETLNPRRSTSDPTTSESRADRGVQRTDGEWEFGDRQDRLVPTGRMDPWEGTTRLGPSSQITLHPVLVCR